MTKFKFRNWYLNKYDWQATLTPFILLYRSGDIYCLEIGWGVFAVQLWYGPDLSELI